MLYLEMDARPDFCIKNPDYPILPCLSLMFQLPKYNLFHTATQQLMTREKEKQSENPSPPFFLQFKTGQLCLTDKVRLGRSIIQW